MKIAYKNRLAALFLGLAFLLSYGNVAWADETRVADYLAQLKAEMTTPAMQGQLPMDNLTQIQAGLDTFEAWAQLLNQASRYQFTVDEYVTVTDFKDKIRTVQSKLFPMLRQATAHALQQELNAIKVTVKGDDFKEIRFTSPILKDMDLTQKMHTDYDLLLKRLRFKQAAFMLDHEDISTLSRFQAPQDGDIALWDTAYKNYALFN